MTSVADTARWALGALGVGALLVLAGGVPAILARAARYGMAYVTPITWAVGIASFLGWGWLIHRCWMRRAIDGRTLTLVVLATSLGTVATHGALRTRPENWLLVLTATAGVWLASALGIHAIWRRWRWMATQANRESPD